MSRKEVPRAGLLKAVGAGKISNAQGAEALHLSVRQFQRLKVRFGAEGPAGLRHRLRGRATARRLPAGNTTHSPRALVSNLSRNLALHLGAPSVRWNRAVDATVRQLHDWMGLDVDDGRTTWPGTTFGVSYTPAVEDTTPAEAHLALIIVTLAALPFARPAPVAGLWLYLCVPIMSTLAFCLLLKWQPWHTRLHIPLISLFIPPVAVLLSHPRLRIAAMTAIAVCVLVLYSTLTDNFRPLLGPRSVFVVDRQSQMFHIRPELAKSTMGTAALIAVRRPATVAFYLGVDDWEYPLQRLLLDHLDGSVVFLSFAGQLFGRQPPFNPRISDIGISTVHDRQTLDDPFRPARYELLSHRPPYAVYALRRQGFRPTPSPPTLAEITQPKNRNRTIWNSAAIPSRHVIFLPSSYVILW